MAAALVSICIPTYNYRPYLPEALESALGQTLREIEIVVVDNCSDDGSWELAQEFAARDPRIVCHRNERNIGMIGNFNRALDLARGRYIKFLCADDVLAPDCVAQMAAAMDDAGIELVGCSRAYFDARGERSVARFSRRRETVPGSAAIRTCFFRGNLIGEPTAVLFRNQPGGLRFNELYAQAFDIEFWMRLLADGGKFASLPQPLCRIRLHGATGTAGNLRSGIVTSGKVRLFSEYAHRPFLAGSWIDRLMWDARMASSSARERAAGSVDTGADLLTAVFYPRLFRLAMQPLGKAAAALGLTPRL
jgi:glycosyltransferase involved in cell wall biosynthesis